MSHASFTQHSVLPFPRQSGITCTDNQQLSLILVDLVDLGRVTPCVASSIPLILGMADYYELESALRHRRIEDENRSNEIRFYPGVGRQYKHAFLL